VTRISEETPSSNHVTIFCGIVNWTASSHFLQDQEGTCILQAQYHHKRLKLTS